MLCELPLLVDRNSVVPYQGVGQGREPAYLSYWDRSAVRISAADRIGTGRKKIIGDSQGAGTGPCRRDGAARVCGTACLRCLNKRSSVAGSRIVDRELLRPGFGDLLGSADHALQLTGQHHE